MKDKSHRQKIEEDMAIKNPDFDRFMKISLAVCVAVSFTAALSLIRLIAGIFNLLS